MPQKYIVFLKNRNSLKFEYEANIPDITLEGAFYSITFQSGSTYSYSRDKVKVYDFASTREGVRIYIKGRIDARYNIVDDYGEYIICRNNKCSSKPIRKSTEIEIINIKLDIQRSQSILDYFKDINNQSNGSSFEVPLEDGSSVEINQISRGIILKALDNIDLGESRSALSAYLDGTSPTSTHISQTLIYPFGCNESQKQAVKVALSNSMSIIEGPPGTGKTQTILNIIANLIVQGKTVAIASNNNSAVFNIQEKLTKYNYGLLVATLGNNVNKGQFFEQLKPQVVSSDFYITPEQEAEAKIEVTAVGSLLNGCFERRNRLAILKAKLTDTEVEFKHLKADHPLLDNLREDLNRKFHCRWSKAKALSLRDILSKRKLSLWGKVRLVVGYLYFDLKNIESHLDKLVKYADYKFYEESINSLRSEIAECDSWLMINHEERLLKRHVELSKMIFNGIIYNRYKDLEPSDFNLSNYKKNFSEFVERYPIVTSSTTSLHTCAPSDYLFDYLIIDEASQVDIIKSSLCLSRCRNAIIVGDSMQLSHIVDSESAELAQQLLNKYSIGEAYNYVEKNILNSLKTLYKANISSTLLKEHYRCHPTIIGYCNKKYYNNELIVMTESDAHPFKIIETNITGIFNNANQRQTDETHQYIIDNYSDNLSRVGVVSPYRNHANMLKSKLPKDVLADTIHKFQGREKDVIIFNTVRGDINQFIDNANLINVAVSRAIDQFIVVKPVSMKLPLGTNIGDLIRYILYTTEPSNTLVKGSLSSVFDLLYKEYNTVFRAFIDANSKISGSAAEIIVHKLLLELLDDNQYNSVDFVREYRLRDLVRDYSPLNDYEKAFIKHNSRLDFLLYSKIDKSPILAIEVDGRSFHQNEIQQRRDEMKNHILEELKLPLLRLSTDGHREKERIRQSLDSAMRCC